MRVCLKLRKRWWRIVKAVGVAAIFTCHFFAIIRHTVTTPNIAEVVRHVFEWIEINS
jgi:hypothetical protein